MPDDAILLGADAYDRSLRSKVEVIGAKADHRTAQLIEGVLEQEQLAGGIDVAALAALRVPGPADLDAIDRGDDVVIARGANDGVALQIANRPRQHVAVALAFQRIADIRHRRARLGHGCEPQLP